MAKHNIFGEKGEEAAFEVLLKNGYLIRDRNWRCGKYEIDIVAEKNNRIIIVEVKTRKEHVPDISQVITRAKIRHLIAAGNAYLSFFRLSNEIQFDVILITGENENDFTVEHIPDAFMAPLQTYGQSSNL